MDDLSTWATDLINEAFAATNASLALFKIGDGTTSSDEDDKADSGEDENATAKEGKVPVLQEDQTPIAYEEKLSAGWLPRPDFRGHERDVARWRDIPVFDEDENEMPVSEEDENDEKLVSELANPSVPQEDEQSVSEEDEHPVSEVDEEAIPKVDKTHVSEEDTQPVFEEDGNSVSEIDEEPSFEADKTSGSAEVDTFALEEYEQHVSKENENPAPERYGKPVFQKHEEQTLTEEEQEQALSEGEQEEQVISENEEEKPISGRKGKGIDDTTIPDDDNTILPKRKKKKTKQQLARKMGRRKEAKRLEKEQKEKEASYAKLEGKGPLWEDFDDRFDNEMKDKIASLAVKTVSLLMGGPSGSCNPTDANIYKIVITHKYGPPPRYRIWIIRRIYQVKNKLICEPVQIGRPDNTMEGAFHIFLSDIERKLFLVQEGGEKEPFKLITPIECQTREGDLNWILHRYDDVEPYEHERDKDNNWLDWWRGDWKSHKRGPCLTLRMHARDSTQLANFEFKSWVMLTITMPEDLVNSTIVRWEEVCDCEACALRVEGEDDGGAVSDLIGMED